MKNQENVMLSPVPILVQKVYCTAKPRRFKKCLRRVLKDFQTFRLGSTKFLTAIFMAKIG